MIINRANLTTLATAFKTSFQGALAIAPSQYRDVSTVVPSTTGTEEYGWMGAIPNVREWLGDRVIHGVTSYGYSIRNKAYELTVGVPRDAIEDDQYGIYTPLIDEMGRAMGAHPDQLQFGLLKNGRVNNGYDGVPFFGATHPITLANGKAGTASNIDDAGGGTTYWYVADLSRAIRPLIHQQRKAPNFVAKTSDTDDNVFDRAEYVYGADARYNGGYGLWQLAQSSNKALDATNLKAAITALNSRKGDGARPLGLRATHLIVSSGQEFEAKELIVNQRLASGADNVLNQYLKVITSPWLD